MEGATVSTAAITTALTNGLNAAAIGMIDTLAALEHD